MHWAFYIVLVIFSLALLLTLYRKYKAWELKKYTSKYSGSYLCTDGHRARSLSEVIIDNALYHHQIPHKSEDLISKNPTDRKYKYDWYLPRDDIYIEFFGYSGKKYYKTRANKEKFYKRHRLTMIALEPKDLSDIEASLAKKLGKVWKNAGKEDQFCPSCGEKLDKRIF